MRIDAKSAVPVYEQIKRAVKLAILSGRLKEGDKLMTLREMAMKLTVNPNTVIKVYDQLENEGFIYSRPGAGYFVSFDAAKVPRADEEVFTEITRDYISKALELGYSRERILSEVAALTEAGASNEAGPPDLGRKERGHD